MTFSIHRNPRGRGCGSELPPNGVGLRARARGPVNGNRELIRCRQLNIDHLRFHCSSVPAVGTPWRGWIDRRAAANVTHPPSSLPAFGHAKRDGLATGGALMTPVERRND